MSLNKSTQNNNIKKNGFTLVELIVVLSIISIITTLVTISFISIRKMNRDGKRVNDIVELQMTLESYRFFEGSYPKNLISGESLIGEVTGKIYMSKIPVNMSYQNFDCNWPNYEYYYDSKSEQYEIGFCLEGDIKKYLKGTNCATPNGILNQNCSHFLPCGDLVVVDSRDGNSYSTIKIGNQCWMTKNLAYLPEVHTSSQFQDKGQNQQPGYGVYEYNGSSIAVAKAHENYGIYGVLYNWFAAMNGFTTSGAQGACPPGWHIPTNEEMNEMIEYLGGDAIGGKLKQTGITYWLSPNTGATNDSGFSALPGGYRRDDGSFLNINENSFILISDDQIDRDLFIFLSYNSNEYQVNDNEKGHGYSVRCLKNY